MLNTNQLYHNGKKKLFTANTKNIEFDVPFTNESNGTVIEIQSHKTNNITKWSMDSIWFRDGKAYSMKFVPTTESIETYPRLAGYRFVIYDDKEKKEGTENDA